MTKRKIPQAVQKHLRSLSLVQLYIIFGGLIENNKCDKDYKITALAYLEKRIKKLQKQKDYEDKNISHKEFVTKWGK